MSVFAGKNPTLMLIFKIYPFTIHFFPLCD
jgi:hypothetical protein